MNEPFLYQDACAMRIRRLPQVVANQIAAGEVIERPASVVKELLENALDAKAREIRVELDFGGLNLIKVSDNGSGILKEDLPLAVMAHATSKVVQLSDLYDIKSMGFRGEALASIASVSRMSIISKPLEQQDAAMLYFDELLQPHTCVAARTLGTTIEVADLFYNAPVRKKFLNNQRSEYLACEAVIKRFAMSCPELAISLFHNGREIFKLSEAVTSERMLSRLSKLMGRNFVASSKRIEVERAGMRLEGWLSGAAYQRSQNDKMWIYLNRRMVKDKLLQHAIKQAYEPYLYPGRHPACILYLSMDSTEVDVNVHPTKHEVRFSQPRLVHDFITSQISEVLKDKGSEDVCLAGLEPELLVSASQAPSVSKYKKPINAYSFVPSLLEQWLPLEGGYGLLRDAHGTHLVDAKSIYRQCLAHSLCALEKPYLPRPLLVPLVLDLSEPVYQSLLQHQDLLIDWGFVFDLMDFNKLRVHALPSPIPQLDIHAFIRHFAMLQSFEAEAVLDVLLRSDLGAEMLDTLMIQEMILPFIKAQHASGLRLDGFLSLTLSHCEALLYG